MILTVLFVLAYLVGMALLLTTVVLSIRALLLAIRALKKYLQP
jgi:hypothetical protein